MNSFTGEHKTPGSCCNIPAELTSDTVVYLEDNIFHSKVEFIPCQYIPYWLNGKRFINQGYGIVYIQTSCHVIRASLLAIQQVFDF